MSKEITIIANNDETLLFIADDNATVRDICAHDDVLDFFAAADCEEVEDALIMLDGASCDNATIKNIVLNTNAENGTTLTFDLEGVTQEEELEDDSEDDDEDASDSPTRGVVAVITSGGLQTTNVAITNGKTTVYEAIYNDQVRTRSGMSDTQLSNCVILFNGDEITQEATERRTVMNGDEIILTARAAATKA